MNGTDNRTAIVTGASRGIGAEIARRLASEGMAVVVNYAHGREAAEAVVGTIRKDGGRAIAVAAEIGRHGAAKALFDAAEEAFGRVDVLVNNAGVMKNSLIADVSDEDFDRHIATNITGTFDTLREAAHRLADGGRIVNFSTSVLGMRLPGYGVYNATKAAVEALTQILAKEIGGRGITVNAVAPGPVATELFFKGKSEEQVKVIAGTNPSNRLGTTEEIADVVALVVSRQARWINGQTIRANGGMV